jgi:hypothetical protein
VKNAIRLLQETDGVPGADGLTLPALSRIRLQHVGDDEAVDEVGHAWMDIVMILGS